MRVALISSLLPADTRGGAEAYVEASALSLAAHHDVVILTGSQHPALDGIATVRLPRLPQLSKRASAVRRVAWHALDQWLPHVHVATVRELRRFAPDIVVTHQPQGLSAGVFTAVTQVGLPHVHTAHDLNLLCARVSMTRDGRFCGGRCHGCLVQRLVRGRAIRFNLSRLIGVSEYVCARHVEAGIIDRERAEAIRLGSEGTPRLRRIGAAPAAVGFIGSLAPHKGVLTLINAMQSEDANWRLVVAGSGELEKEVAAAASRNGRIDYLGHVAGEAKHEFYSGLDLVVIPSEWEEPATFVAAEAAVRGIPAVVSDRGGLPETPEARVFSAGDPRALLEAVQWFVEEPQRLADASIRLLARREDFLWATHMRRVEELLAEVIAEQGEGGRGSVSPPRA